MLTLRPWGHGWLAAAPLLVLCASSFAGCSDGSDHDGPPPALGPSTPTPPPDDTEPPPPDDTEPPPPPQGSSNLRVFIEDAPPAWDTLRSVRLEIGSVAVIRGQFEQPPPPTVHALTRLQPGVDVLPLRGGRRVQLAAGTVPEDGYLLELVLTGAEVVTASRTYSSDNGLLALAGGTALPGGGRRYVITPAHGGGTEAEVRGSQSDLFIDVDLEESLEAEGDPGQPTRITLTPRARLVSAEDGTLRGVVRSDGGTPDDPADDVPIADAHVWIEDFGPRGDPDPRRLIFKRTDAQGVYELKGARNGARLWVDAPGHETITGEPIEGVSGTRTRDVLLRKNPGAP